MGSLKTTAIVSRCVNYRDYDRIVTLFSREYGQIDAAARGCRRQKSPLLAIAQPFCFGDFILFEKQDRYTITHCDIRHTFHSFTEDIDALSIASCMLSLCRDAANPGEESHALFSLLIHALAAAEADLSGATGILATFLVRYARLIGYEPVLEKCCACGKPLTAELYFCGDGALCARCTADREDAASLPSAALNAMIRAERIATKQIGELKYPKKLGARISRLMLNYLENHMEVEIRAPEILS